MISSLKSWDMHVSKKPDFLTLLSLLPFWLVHRLLSFWRGISFACSDIPDNYSQLIRRGGSIFLQVLSSRTITIGKLDHSHNHQANFEKFSSLQVSIEKTNRIQRSQLGSRKNGQWIDLKDRIYGIKSQHEVLLSGLKLTWPLIIVATHTIQLAHM